jgi:flagellar biosynthesis protein FlhF
MRVNYQTFRGADVKQALDTVRAALGPEAFIGSTREVSNGRGGALKHAYVEVTAAPPEKMPSRWAYSRDARTEAAVRDSLLDSSVQASPKPVLAGLFNGANDVERELRTLRAMLEELSSGRPPKDRAMTVLRALGLEDVFARDIARGISKMARKGEQVMLTELRRRIRERLKINPGLLARRERQVIACIGPTGAGKTTTLAKMAARAKLDMNRRIAVVSLDTYRVGATEQWQRYAALLGIPFDVAENPDHLIRMVESSPAELVLVDTAGRHHEDSQNSWRLPRLVQSATRTWHIQLVLPAWLRAPDAASILKTYEDALPSGVVVTKVDETTQIGGVIQTSIQGDLPVSFVCDGPRVPEDLNEPDADDLIALLFSQA